MPVMPTYEELVSSRGQDFPAGAKLPPLTGKGSRLLNREEPGAVPFLEGLVFKMSVVLTGNSRKIFLEREISSPRGPVIERVQVKTNLDIF